MNSTRILIVEDELVVARDISHQLRAMGYEPIGTTPRGDEALALAAQHHPDLILMDIQLDGPVDGVEAARRIREIHAIPVIFLTAFASEPALARAKTAGPFGYIVKPFEEQELRMAIEVALNLHQIEARLRTSEARTRLLSRAVEQCPVSIIITGADGRIEYVNPHFTKATGYSAGEAAAQNPRLLKSGRQSPEFYARMWSTIWSGREWSGEFHNRRKDGSLFWEHASISPVRSDDGRITHFVAVKEDITSRKEAEDNLLQAKAELQETNARLEVSIRQARDLASAAETANQAKSAFLATMSHELRTPLNVINGVSATLLEQDPPPSQRTALDLIHHSGQNLLGIIEEVLDYTGLQAGQATLDSQPCELAAIAFHSLRLAAERAAGKGVDVRCQIDPSVPGRVITDGRKLGQVLTNLLCNAVKFTEYGHVELGIAARRPSPGIWALEFVVRDTGIGIADDQLTRLFQPFSQADGTITRRFGGSGLGLAISRTLAHLLGGDITVQSRPREGSTFTFSMTCGFDGDGVSLLAAGPRAALCGRRALIAAAHASHGSYLESVLRSTGVECAVLDQGTLLPGVYGPGNAFDVLVIEAEALPPGLRSRWDRLHVGEDSAPVLWISSERGGPAPTRDGRARTLTWPVAPDELQRAFADLLRPAGDGTEARPTPAAPTSEPLGRRLPLRILAADDVRINREVLRMMLSHLGYAPDFAENGVEVLEALSRRTYDLVLLDVQMPVMDGLSAAREICRRFADSPSRPRLVAITANALPEARKECLAAGMDDYLSKPVVPRQLEACFFQLFRAEAPTGTPVSPPPPAPVAASVPEWIDRTHLATLTAARTPQESRSLLAQLVASFQEDFQSLLPRLQRACADRDGKAAILLVHGLKGGALTLGWSQFVALCSRSLEALRAGMFSDWGQLPGDLENLFAHSLSAAEATMEAWPDEVEAPAGAPREEAVRHG